MKGGALRAVARLVAALLVAASSASAQQAPHSVTGVVVAQAGQAPLGHSMVSLEPVGRETFTDDQGRFAFLAVPPGRYRIRVAHLGFTPKEIPLEVPADSGVTRLRIDLASLQVRLATVRISAEATCTVPGPPDANKERDFLALFEQLEQNAKQFTLLADSFPYSYTEQRTTLAIRSDSIILKRKIDTLLLKSNKPAWTYAPGRVVVENDAQGLMHLPLLSDFASDAFIKSHCFRYGGGVETLEGPALRIDFRADDRLRSPDVNGTILLDAKSYQIRSAVLQLSRIPEWMGRFVASVRATMLFREVEPSVLVLSHIHGVTTMYPPRLDMIATASLVDDQTLIAFGFVANGPGQSTRQP